ncbi:MAG: hypothetical protein IJC39_05820, partial [Firmicutes bacterium]|nr:hypothetical protein [Bacillota bacterium]
MMFGVKMIGNVHDYAKNTQMMTDLKFRHETGSIVAGTDKSASEPKSLVEELTVKPQEEEQGFISDQDKMKLIKHKLQLGSSLTKEELKFLKDKAPELHDEYIRAEEEREQEEKAFKEALKRCRTKEEVDRLKTANMSRFASRAEFIANNPHIPEDKKSVLIGAEKRKMQDTQEAVRKFVESGKYRELPAEREVREIEKAEAEEKRVRMGLDENGTYIPKEKKPVSIEKDGRTECIGNDERNDERAERLEKLWQKKEYI